LNKEHVFRSKELYGKVKDLVKKTFRILNEKMKRGEKFYSRTIEDISIDEDGKLHLATLGYRDYYIKPDFGGFILRHADELEQLPEWRAVLECMSRDDIIDKHLKHQLVSPFGGSMINEFSLLYKIILMSIDENEPFNFNLDIFNSVYSEIERYFYSKNVTRKSICLLLGFDSEVEAIDLGDCLKIRKISKDEIVELWRTSHWFRALVEFFPEFRFTPLKYVLELSIEAPKIAGNEKYEVEPADVKFEKVISVLRLFKKGWVDYPFIRERVTPTLFSETIDSMKHSKMNIISPPFGISYKLLKEEVEEFKEYYEKINKKIDCSKVPLRRFNETYRRVSAEDKLIDYMIAFESLYLAKEGTLEMPYKLAHRVSLLLYEEETKRKQTFLEMKKSYSLRSDIVHGRKIRSIKIDELNKEYNLSEFVQKIEEHLRLSIRLFLEKERLSWIDLMFKRDT
jgi:hypothetical protein